LVVDRSPITVQIRLSGGLVRHLTCLAAAETNYQQAGHADARPGHPARCPATIPQCGVGVLTGTKRPAPGYPQGTDREMLAGVRQILAAGQTMVHSPTIYSDEDTYYSARDLTINRGADLLH
jgi:hypothetical protein